MVFLKYLQEIIINKGQKCIPESFHFYIQVSSGHFPYFQNYLHLFVILSLLCLIELNFRVYLCVCFIYNFSVTFSLLTTRRESKKAEVLLLEKHIIFIFTARCGVTRVDVVVVVVFDPF